jgi:tRNA threonylcarbamoyladenosine biosynthesis protein TsaE
MITLTAANPSDTAAIAAVLARLAKPGDMFVLIGEMGAGKTFFAQQFGAAFGVTEPITSPTFNLLHNYSGGRLPLHHADLYRLERTGEFADLGISELTDAGGVALVEWGDVVDDIISDGLTVALTHVDDNDDARRLKLAGVECSGHRVGIHSRLHLRGGHHDHLGD